MSNDPIVARLVGLSEHDRSIAQAQLARAEAIVDPFAAAAGWVRRGWKALVVRVRASNDGLTRQWPHRQALR